MMTVNDAFRGQMEPQIRALRDAELTVARVLKQIGPSEAVDRFLSRNWARAEEPLANSG